MSATSHIEHLCISSGLEPAYTEACRTVRQQAADVDALWQSRFFERRILENGSKKLWPVTMSSVSSAYDMADCDDGEPREFLYCNADGELYPVTVGGQSRINPDPDGPDEVPFIHASSDMVANGKVVGHVLYTDH